MLLKGKVAIVTGAAHGIGQAIAARYAEEGAKVVVADYDVEGGQQTAGELRNRGYPVVFCQVDVRDQASLAAALQTTIDTFGRLDIAVANAGINHDGHVVDTPLADWQRIIDVNLTGAFLTVKVCAAHLIQQGLGGRIILASSEAGKKGEAGAAAYCASKFGVIGLLECLALELAEHGITVNGVCPGMIDSDMLRWLAEEEARKTGQAFDEVWHGFRDVVPMARAFNAREGFSAGDDQLPSRCFEPISSGPLEGVAIDDKAFADALATYCRMSGLDERTGAPTQERLAELDILWVAEELARHGLERG